MRALTSSCGQDQNSSNNLSPASESEQNQHAIIPTVKNQDFIVQYLYSKQTNTNILLNKKLNSEFDITSVIETSHQLYLIHNFDVQLSVQRANDIILLGVKSTKVTMRALKT